MIRRFWSLGETTEAWLVLMIVFDLWVGWLPGDAVWSWICIAGAVLGGVTLVGLLIARVLA